MKNLNYQAELQKIITDKRVVETYFYDASSFGTSYVLNTNEEFITLGIIAHNDVYMGVGIFHLCDVESITTDTAYLRLLEKIHTNKSLHTRALLDIKDVNEFTVNGFISYIEESATLAEVCLEDDSMFVKIVGHDDSVIEVEEYALNKKGMIARTFYKIEDIKSIVLHSPRLRLVELAQAE